LNTGFDNVNLHRPTLPSTPWAMIDSPSRMFPDSFSENTSKWAITELAPAMSWSEDVRLPP